MSERRFSEEEVAEILKQAAEAEHADRNLLKSGSGLTLTELNDIGREVGISAEAIQHAARRFDTTDQTTRRFLGLAIGVGRTVELDRKLTDDEWDRLVVDLRETFDARGVIKQEGTLRSWTNGNLQVLLEPTSTGQRLRMKTLKGSAQGLIGGGAGIFLAAVFLLVTAALKGPITDTGFLASIATLGAGGIGMFAAGALGIPSWARLRRRQMDQIAERASSRLPDL
jgi:hypothetical protein